MSFKEKILRNAFSLKSTRRLRRETGNNLIRNVYQVLVSPIGEAKFQLQKCPESSHKYKLGIVCIVKNEADYIEEWIRFHLIQGVEKIILYDNGSTDGTQEKIQPFVEAKQVVLIEYPGSKVQCDVYNDAIARFGAGFTYLAILDADEFLYPSKSGEKLIDEIERAFSQSDGIGGLTVNWLCYGSSGFEKKPEGLVTESYLKRGKESFEANENYKSIVKPEAVFSFTCPHDPHYRKGRYAVNTEGQRIDTPTAPGVYTALRINHYFTKSKEEYIAKMNRGKADRSDKRGMDDFYRHDVNDVYDDSPVFAQKSRL